MSKQPLGVTWPLPLTQCDMCLLTKSQDKGTCQATPWGYLAPPTVPMPKMFLESGKHKACSKQTLGFTWPLPLTPCEMCLLTKSQDKGMCQAIPRGYLAPPTVPMPKMFLESGKHKACSKQTLGVTWPLSLTPCQKCLLTTICHYFFPSPCSLISN